MEEDSGKWIQDGFAQESRDIERRQMTMDRMRAEQSLQAGVVAGLLASIVGAAAWAAISALTRYQIGWMAVAVAGLVGFAIRRVGKGIDARFGCAGAVLALWGCALGNYLVICIQVASEYEVGFTRVLTSLSPWQAAQILVSTLGLHEVLFYGIALVAGYRLSIRSVTEADILRGAGP